MSETATQQQAQMKPNGFCHAELASNDVSATKTFFEKTFGWKFNPAMEGYDMYEAPGPLSGGLRPVEAQQKETPAIMNYIYTTDLDAKINDIKANGGNILAPKMEVKDHGWMAVIQAPGGIVFGLWQDAGHK